MSSSYSPNTASDDSNTHGPSAASHPSWGQWSDNIFDQEKVVFKDNVPLVISTALSAAIYSYTMIDGNTNNAINRALIMALSSFVGASAVNMLQNNGYLDASGNNRKYLEGAIIPVVYYYITRRQFQLPDLQSQAIKTGVISTVIGELANPTVASYYNNWEGPVKPASS